MKFALEKHAMVSYSNDTICGNIKTNPCNSTVCNNLQGLTIISACAQQIQRTQVESRGDRSSPSHLPERRVLQSTQDVLGPLCVARCLTQQEDGERRSLGPLGDIDQLLETRHTQRDVLGRHTGVVESVERHLRGRLSQRLSGQSADHLTRVNLWKGEQRRFQRRKTAQRTAADLLKFCLLLDSKFYSDTF